jgi:hypothetical protein
MLHVHDSKLSKDHRYYRQKCLVYIITKEN